MGGWVVMQLCSYVVMQLCSYAVLQLCSYAVVQFALTVLNCLDGVFSFIRGWVVMQPAYKPSPSVLAAGDRSARPQLNFHELSGFWSAIFVRLMIL